LGRNNFEHGEFSDWEISHNEMELARENQHMTQRMGKVFGKTESKMDDIGLILAEAKSSTHENHNLLVHTMAKALRCEVIISTLT
jgi:hypothetical protein